MNLIQLDRALPQLPLLDMAAVLETPLRPSARRRDAAHRSPLHTLSVIIPFHKNLAQLRRCLAAVQSARLVLPQEVEITDFTVVADGALEDPSELARTFGATVVAVDGPRGPAAARNLAAAVSTGDLLVFVDADVLLDEPALAKFAALFAAENDLAAAFGSYDQAPADQGFLAQCRNLGHSFIHHRANREAQTFWAGVGAVRASVFASVGGFDERFKQPSVEDIDLGYRIRTKGGRIVLDPSIQGKHLKRWTFRSSVITDVQARGIPWTQLTHRYVGMHNDLNLTFKYRACVVIAYLLILLLVAAWWRPESLVGVALALFALWLLDLHYYRYFIRLRGFWFAIRWFPFHIFHHLCNGFSFAVGTTLSLLQRWMGLTLPGTLPAEPWPARSTPGIRLSEKVFSE